MYWNSVPSNRGSGERAIASAAVSGYAGLVLSYRAELPAGPAIILVAGVLYILSVIVGPVGGLVWLVLPRRHLEA